MRTADIGSRTFFQESGPALQLFILQRPNIACFHGNFRKMQAADGWEFQIRPITGCVSEFWIRHSPLKPNASGISGANPLTIASAAARHFCPAGTHVTPGPSGSSARYETSLVCEGKSISRGPGSADSNRSCRSAPKAARCRKSSAAPRCLRFQMDARIQRTH